MPIYFEDYYRMKNSNNNDNWNTLFFIIILLAYIIYIWIKH